MRELVVAVLDTNVLVSALVGDIEPDCIIIRQIELASIVMCANRAVLYEYKNVFANPTLRVKDQEYEVTDKVRDRLDSLLRYNAKLVNDKSLPPSFDLSHLQTDTRDKKFLIASGQAFGSTNHNCSIITRDRDLLKIDSALLPVGVLVSHPYAFIEKLSQLV